MDSGRQRHQCHVGTLSAGSGRPKAAAGRYINGETKHFLSKGRLIGFYVCAMWTKPIFSLRSNLWVCMIPKYHVDELYKLFYGHTRHKH